MKKSEISMPEAGHKGIPAHKTNHPIAEASAGSHEYPDGKSHDGDVQLGEGLEYGAVHSAHKKDGVREAKHVGSGSQNASRGHQARRENNGADPSGDCGAM